MSGELSNANSSNTSLASYALMPSVYVGTNAINNYRHFKSPFRPYAGDINVKKFGELTKNSGLDVFQRAQFASESAEAVRSASMSLSKASKKLQKLENYQKGAIPFKEKIFNILRKKENKITKDNLAALIENAKKTKKEAGKNVSDIAAAINSKNAQNLKTTLEGIDEGYKNSMKFIEGIKSGQSALKSFGSQVTSNFKKEFSLAKGNRFNAGFNYVMTAIQFIPNIFSKVVPAFKNNGFKAGMTELGQTLLQAGTDLVAYAAGGAVGRTIGAAIGALVVPLNPIGAFIGGLVGDMLGSMFVGGKACGVVEKITNKDDYKNTGNVELATEEEKAQIAVSQQTAQIAASQEAAQATVPQGTTRTKTQSGSRINVTQENLTPEQLQKLAYAQAFPKNASKIGKYYA